MEVLHFTYFALSGGDQVVTASQLDLTTIVSMPFGENTYVARIKGRDDCLVIDPGMEPELIFEHLDRNQLSPAAILITHGHADHIGGNRALKERWPRCPLVIGVGDAPKLTSAQLNLSAPFGIPIDSPPADVTIDDGDTYVAGGVNLHILGIPGHSAGHVVYLCKEASPYVAFVGDVIFAGSIGRTDFPDGDFHQLAHGIHTKLFTLPGDTRLLPGHGSETTVEQERRTNPFVGQKAGQ
jgi:glyoxylase-like metal-dependent hydrolase (beta-lactamase superfamily II)